jgi:hypothetical protein
LTRAQFYVKNIYIYISHFIINEFSKIFKFLRPQSLQLTRSGVQKMSAAQLTAPSCHENLTAVAPLGLAPGNLTGLKI